MLDQTSIGVATISISVMVTGIFSFPLLFLSEGSVKPMLTFFPFEFWHALRLHAHTFGDPSVTDSPA